MMCSRVHLADLIVEGTPAVFSTTIEREARKAREKSAIPALRAQRPLR
jgi:hypothetical protein